MINQIYTIRGATTVDSDTPENIISRSAELIREIVMRNGLDAPDVEVTECMISSTGDITSFYPARAIRESGAISAPLFSALEPPIAGALPLCIRLAVRVARYGERREPKHVYLHGAVRLRPDLAGK